MTAVPYFSPKFTGGHRRVGRRTLRVKGEIVAHSGEAVGPTTIRLGGARKRKAKSKTPSHDPGHSIDKKTGRKQKGGSRVKARGGHW